MPDDSQLLRRFATDRSEAAFGELVTRHVPLVYSAALRQTGGDAHLAQDIAQVVFADLARKAAGLSENVVLAGWLHRATIFAARQILRGERRRKWREQQAVTMNAIQSETENNDWQQIRPLLDEALNRLNKTDRDALLLRFFENQSLAQVGASLGGSEDAARKRVNRALEKLRVILTKRGVTTTAAALSTAISANAIQVAPAGLAATLANASLAVAGTGTTFTLLKIMTATKLKLGISALVVAGAATAIVVQHQTQNKLRAENESLRQQITQLQSDNESLSRRVAQAKPAPHLPAPTIQMVVVTNAAPAEDLELTNLYGRFLGKWPKLTAAQVETYLKANRTNAASLLAAYRASGDLALLKEAMEKYSNNPEVAFAAALDKNLSPEEQRQWLNTFEQDAPNNALVNYLSALNYFNSGQIDQGVQELTAASGKQLDDYTLDRVQDEEEAYLSAGYSQAEAETIASQSLMLSQDPQVKQLGQDLISLANAYSQSGDQDSAQASLQMAMNLGQNMANKSSSMALINQLTGLSIETLALNAMNPNSPYGSNGQTVQDQLNQIAQYRTSIRQLAQQAEPLLPTLSDQALLDFDNRRMMFGETAAMQWVVSKFGQQ
ncbi:MAG: RNA polymerase sigma factor [Limisphaerales bacterium]